MYRIELVDTDLNDDGSGVHKTVEIENETDFPIALANALSSMKLPRIDHTIAQVVDHLDSWGEWPTNSELGHALHESAKRIAHACRDNSNAWASHDRRVNQRTA